MNSIYFSFIQMEREERKNYAHVHVYKESHKGTCTIVHVYSEMREKKWKRD